MVTIKINSKDYQFDERKQLVTALITKAGFDPAQYDLFVVKQNGRSDPVHAEHVELHDGEEFRVLPKDLNFGSY